MSILRTLLVVVIFGWSSAAAFAEPIHMATFTLSKDHPLTCDYCLDGWTEAIARAFEGTSSAKLTTGHIILVNLAYPGLEPLVTDRDPGNDACGDFVGATRYDPEKIPQPLPVLLKTVPDWAASVDVDIAFSGANFKFQNEGGVRANPPCGEMIGVDLHNGQLDWPPETHPELLHELIDHDENWPAYALVFKADRTARIEYLSSFEQLDGAAYAIGGSMLYNEDEVNPTPGSKPASLIARLGVGILPDPTKILIIELEGHNNNTQGIARGHRLSRLRLLFQELGAVSAINLDGSGSAHIVARNPALGASSRPADTEGARPIANHFGFKILNEPVEWTPYHPPQHDDRDD